MTTAELLEDLQYQRRQINGLLARTEKIIEELSKSEKSAILINVKPNSQTSRTPPKAPSDQK